MPKSELLEMIWADFYSLSPSQQYQVTLSISVSSYKRTTMKMWQTSMSCRSFWWKVRNFETVKTSEPSSVLCRRVSVRPHSVIHAASYSQYQQPQQQRIEQPHGLEVEWSQGVAPRSQIYRVWQNITAKFHQKILSGCLKIWGFNNDGYKPWRPQTMKATNNDHDGHNNDGHK